MNGEDGVRYEEVLGLVKRSKVVLVLRWVFYLVGFLEGSCCRLVVIFFE